MKRRLGFTLLAALAVAGFYIVAVEDGTVVGVQASDKEAAATPTAPERDQAGVEDARHSLVAPPVADDIRVASVTHLADGDSFDIEWQDTGDRDEIRLFGINAPESTACFGTEAREVLESLTEDQPIMVESVERDDFGRILANVWVDDVFVNGELVAVGAALALSDNGRHANYIEQAQQFASESGAGLWDRAACGSDPSTRVTIGSINADARGQDHLNPNGEWITITNDGATAATMTGWSIRDESTRHRYFFPDGFALESGASVRVFSGCGEDRADELFWCDGDPVWNNTGDTGFLVDPDGKFADSLSYQG